MTWWTRSDPELPEISDSEGEEEEETDKKEKEEVDMPETSMCLINFEETTFGLLFLFTLPLIKFMILFSVGLSCW